MADTAHVPSLHAMSTGFFAFLDAFNPMRERVSVRGVTLRTIRLMCVFLIVLMPGFWGVYSLSDQSVKDPLVVRLGVIAIAAVLLILTFRDSPIRKRPQRYFWILPFVVTTWLGWLAFVNQMAPDYALGYLFSCVGLTVSYSVARQTSRSFATYVGGAFGVAVVVAVSVENPGVSPVLFLACTGFSSVLLSVVVGARLALANDIARRERVAADMERLAQIGTLEIDLRTGERWWSDGMFRIVGLDPLERSPPKVFDFLHPEDDVRVREDERRVLAFGTHIEQQFRIVTQQKETRDVRTVIRVMRDAAETPVHLTGVCIDVTRQAERERSLRRARDEAEKARFEAESAARAKSAFLANMSHEIRTPLTSIIGYAQVLGDDVGAEHQELVTPIETGGRRLLDTLNSVLDLARIEAGRMSLERRPVDIAREAREAERLFARQAQEQGLVLEVEVPSEPVWVLGDSSALARVLTNLISNAIKFTDTGTVSVTVQPAGEHVLMDVQDTGRGMSASFLEQLFEPFRQESDGWDRSHEGSGLGLSITRRLVEQMGGALTVDSEQGKGSTFRVSLAAAFLEQEAPDQGQASLQHGERHAGRHAELPS